MLSLVLLFAVWPFQHKRPASDVQFNPNGVQETAPVDTCDKSGDLYFYAGEDKMIGISPASCVDAKHNWAVTHVDPVKMSRS